MVGIFFALRIKNKVCSYKLDKGKIDDFTKKYTKLQNIIKFKFLG